LLLFWSYFTANSWLTMGSVLMLPVLASLLWFAGEPPVLLFASLIQWLQAAVAIYYANYYNQSLADVNGIPEFYTATWLSLLGVLALAAGMRLAVWRRVMLTAETDREAGRLEARKIFAVYLTAFVSFYFLGQVAYLIPALRQPLMALTTLRWVLVYLLFYTVLRQKRNYALLTAVMLLELVVGFLGFFSAFRGVFLILLVVLPTAQLVVTGWRVLQAVVIAIVLIALSVVWTVVKEEYRAFLNQDTNEQVVMGSVSERIEKLTALTGELNGSKIQDGLDRLILRVSYVNYFALCLINVPANVPHENGKLWMEAFEHVLMPRFLFPDKAALDDSVRTSHYTGLQVAGQESGSSIGIGYIGESYVDFGKAGMFAPIFLLGVFFGLIYRYFTRYRHATLGFAMGTAILIFGACELETSNVKLFGGNLMSFAVLAVFARFGGEWLWYLITSTQPRAAGQRRQASPHAKEHP
jgi:hypothetical protein